MSNEKISQLTSGNPTEADDLLVVARPNGLGGFNNFKVNQASPGQTVYVDAKKGDDTKGNGSPTLPFQTIAHATSYILGLGTATFSNQFNIKIASGTYSETGLKVYPNINWIGGQVSLSNNTAINLDSSWAGKTQTTASFTASGINIPSTQFILDGTGLSSPGGIFHFENFNTSQATSFISGGASSSNVVMFLGSCSLATSTGNVSFDSIILYSHGGNAFVANGGNVNVTTATDSTYLYIQDQVETDGTYNFTTTGGLGITLDYLNGSEININNITNGVASAIALNFDMTTAAYPAGSVSGNLAGLSVSISGYHTNNVLYVGGGDPYIANGSPNFPYSSISVATSAAIALSPSLTSPVNIMIAPGTYSVTGLTLNPNINYFVNGEGGVNWTGIGSIVFNNVFTSSAAQLSLGAISVSGISLNLDSSGLSNFNCTINIDQGFNTTTGCIFKSGAAQTYNLNLNGAVSLAQGATATFDSITVSGDGAHSIGSSGVVCRATNQNLNFTSVGNVGIGTIAAFGSTHQVNVSILAGYPVALILTDNVGSSLTFKRDATTWQSGSTYSGSQASTIIDQNTSFIEYLGTTGLTDASTVNWNVATQGVNVTLATTAARTIALPTNFYSGQTLTLALTSNGFQPTWASGYFFPNGVPPVSTVANQIDTYVFFAVAGQLNLISYTSSVPNWNNWTGENNLPASSFSVLLQASTGGVSIVKIPNTSNVLVVTCQATTNIIAFVATYDSTGKLTYPTAPNWTTITPTSLIAAKPMVCVMTDGLNAIISYQATTSAVSCVQLTPIAISGTTLTVGTTTQVRATETASGNASVRELDTSNFSVVLRTATSNILYAYPCSVSGSTITVGSSPLTIETGNTSTIDTYQAIIDSTHTMLQFRSTVTATAGFMYAAVLTFSGTGSAPTIGTKLQLSTSTPAATNLAVKVSQFLNNSSYYIFCWKDSTSGNNTVNMQVIQNVAGTPTVTGTVFSSDNRYNNSTINFFQTDANHCIAFGNNQDQSASGFMVIAIDSSYNMSQTYTLNPVNLSILSPAGTGKPTSLIGINNNTMGLFGFTNNTGNNIISYQVLRT